MSNPPFRPTRPSAVKAAEAAKSSAASRIVEGESRISVRTTADNHHAIKKAALDRRITLKRLVLEALRKDGVELALEPDE